MKKIIVASTLLLTAMTMGAAAAEPAKSTAKLTMELILAVCVPLKGDLQKIELAAQKIHLVEMTPEHAQPFLAGVSGKAWSNRDDGGLFVLTATAPDTCSVYINQVNAQELKREFAYWLPPKNSPYSVEKGREQKQGDTETVSYAILRDGRLAASWLLWTEDRQPHGAGMVSVRTNDGHQ